MTSLFNITFNCVLCLLVIQLTITASSSIFSMTITSLLDLSNFYFMLVTTRSQTKRLPAVLAESSMISTLPSTKSLDASVSQQHGTSICREGFL
jgi:hypothetical protein